MREIRNVIINFYKQRLILNLIYKEKSSKTIFSKLVIEERNIKAVMIKAKYI
jgi:hypothetical protein